MCCDVCLCCPVLFRLWCVLPSVAPGGTLCFGVGMCADMCDRSWVVMLSCVLLQCGALSVVVRFCQSYHYCMLCVTVCDRVLCCEL